MTKTVMLTTGQVISIAREFLACPVSVVVKALNELTDDNIYTHQIPRAMGHVQPTITSVCPWVSDIDLPDVDHIEDKEELEKVVYGWVDGISWEHGTQHEVPVCTEGWTKMSPIDELAMMFGDRVEDGE